MFGVECRRDGGLPFGQRRQKQNHMKSAGTPNVCSSGAACKWIRPLVAGRCWPSVNLCRPGSQIIEIKFRKQCV